MGRTPLPKVGMVNEEKLLFSVSSLVSETGMSLRDNYIHGENKTNDLFQSLRVLSKIKPVL